MPVYPGDPPVAIDTPVALANGDAANVSFLRLGAHTGLVDDVVILEGLDLSGVAPGVYELLCLPLKLDGGAGDGAPARAVLRR
ncbi:MAG: hypothetical protein P1P87_01550 [Trueperaceae bacterium]|nr:hypothetical protein [Trueperaceae bacterium]